MYKFNINDILKRKSSKIKIIKRFRNSKNKIRTYQYKCLKCGNIDIITEYNLKDGKGCNVCASKKVLKGYNDMWTTNPNLASLLANPEDGYKYMQNSSKKVDWKCPNCGNIINRNIFNINRQGFSCPKCSDNISYPEKIVYSILKQLEINFIYQLTKTTFNWCKKYRYDFYFKINNKSYIIETHGKQHYKQSFNMNKARTLKEEQENDKIKKELALINNIKEMNYIVIDCSYSELEFIKNNILHSRLNEIFDLSKINWLKCHEFACSSLVKQACEYWNDGIKSTIQISKKMQINNNTIRNYLKQGTELGICTYDSKEVIKRNCIKNLRDSSRKVICLNNKQIFNSIKEARINTGAIGIYSCCVGKTKTSGRSPINNEKLKWMYYDKYLKLNKLKTHKYIKSPTTTGTN